MPLNRHVIRVNWVASFVAYLLTCLAAVTPVVLSDSWLNGGDIFRGATLFAIALPIILVIPGFIWLLREIERVSVLNVLLRAAASHDEMTGLLTWSAFHSTLRAADASSRNPPEDRKALLLIDIDDFKSVNDRWGHAAGDIVLKAVAERVAQQVGTLGVIGRLGGEEFGIFMAYADAEHAMALAQLLRTVISVAPLRLADGTNVPLTISIAVIAYSAPTTSEAAMIVADQLLYRAKAKGRDRVES